jgi:hypothetical protein
MDKDWPREFPGMNWMDEQEEQVVLDVIRNGPPFRYYGPRNPSHAAPDAIAAAVRGS